MQNKQSGSWSLRPILEGAMVMRLLLFLMVASALNAKPAMAFLRGTNMAGPQFGGLPGVIDTDYGYNSEASFTYFGNKGLGLTRVGPLWERIQPTLNGPLDTTNVNALNNNIAWAKLHGCQVSIELHNYGRYNINEGGTYHEYIIDNQYGGVTKVSTANLCDVWVKISNLYKNEPGVYAYDLMNEPHDMGAANWNQISQAVVTAIRNNGDNKLIYVPGSAWSSAANWVSANGSTAWITDPAHNIKYEAHQYFDSNAAGAYNSSYDAELAANPNLATVGVDRLTPFANWCSTNGVQGYIGEYGVPNTDPRWLTVLDNFLYAADAAGMDATIWAAGERWGTYPLSVEPTNNFTTDAVQMPILLKHPGTGTATSGPVALNCGGAVSNPFVADNDFSGGTTASTASAITTTGVPSPAPQAVYQTCRRGNATYTIAGLGANAPYTVRLHFAEFQWNAANARKFNVTLNGVSVLSNFDIWAAAGGQNKAIVQQFNVNANGGGQVIVALTNVVDNAQINGIEVIGTPVAPANLVGIAATNSAALYWKANANATSYNVKRSTVSGSGYATVAGPVFATYTDTGLTNGTTYYYVVTMVNAAGESANSSQVSVVPLTPPSGNTHAGTWDVQGTLQSSATWNTIAQTATAAPNSDYVASFWLKGTGVMVMRVFSGAYASEITRVTCNATSTWQRFSVYVNTGSATQMTMDIADGGGVAGTVYIDDCFLGPPGGANTLTSGDFEGTNTAWSVAFPPFVICRPDGPAPSAPTGLFAQGGTSSVDLFWNAGGGATSYSVKRSTVSGSGYSTIATGGNPYYTDTGLSNGTTYYYVVSAANGGGQSPDSAQASATPVAAPSGNTYSGTWALQGVLGSVATWNFTSQAPTVTPNASYLASFWLKGSGAVVFRLYNGSYQGEITRKTCNATSTWQRFTIPVSTGANTQMTFDIADGGGIAGTVFIDDCFLGVPGGANKLVNGDFESGNVTWGVGNPPFSIIQPGGGSPPSAPTGLTATPGNAQVALSWTASGAATSYNVLRSTVNGSGYASVATGITPTSYTNTGLTNGTTYYFVVTATNPSGTSGNSNQASATPSNGPPGVPTGLTATPGNTQAALAWTASSGATSYNVLRSTVSGSGYTSVATGIIPTSYTNTGLTNGTTYYFVVSATNSSGTSANSSQVSAIPVAGAVQAQLPNGTPTIDGSNADAVWTGATSYAITKVTGTVGGSSDLSASWKGAWDGSNLYILVDVTDDVKTNDSTNPWDDDAVEIFLDADHNGGTTYDANDRQVVCGWGDSAPVEGAGRSISGAAFAKADPTGTTYRIEAKVPWAIEAFAPTTNAVIGIDVHVDDDDDGGARDGKLAWNDGTDQAWQNPSLFGTGKLLAAGSAPPAATGLTATAGNTQVALSWTASSGATSYNALRSTVSGSGYASVATSIATTSYTNTGLTNGTTYYFVVSATNSTGTSANSTQASATPNVSVPPVPPGLTATEGNAQVALSWSASSGATAYDVKRSTVSGSGYVTVSSPTTTSYTNTGLTNGTTYYYVVAAKNAAGSSVNSSQVSATPAAGGGALANASFETPALSFGQYQYNSTGGTWTFASNSGIANNGSGFGNPTAPNGTQVAFLQGFNGVNGSISQSVTFTAGNDTISFQACQRNQGGQNTQSIKVFVDGTLITTIAPASTSFALYTTPSFAVTAGAHTVTLTGGSTSGDQTAFIDCVAINPAGGGGGGGVTIPNNGFETPDVGSQNFSAFQYNPAGASWTFGGGNGPNGAGISGNGSGFTSGNPNSPVGAQVGFLEGTSSLSQSLTFPSTANYTITFQAAQRQNNGTSTQQIQVLIDSTVVYTVTPTGTTYAAYTSPSFNVTSGSHTLWIKGTAATDMTAFLDAVAIN